MNITLNPCNLYMMSIMSKKDPTVTINMACKVETGQKGEKSD